MLPSSAYQTKYAWSYVARARVCNRKRELLIVLFLVPWRRQHCPTGSPSSKYEHRRASVLLRNIRNIRNCTGKKPLVFVTYENGRISIKNSLPYTKCVLRLSCVVHGPIYGSFKGDYKRFSLYIWGLPSKYLLNTLKTLFRLSTILLDV